LATLTPEAPEVVPAPLALALGRAEPEAETVEDTLVTMLGLEDPEEEELVLAAEGVVAPAPAEVGLAEAEVIPAF
jgi:hypothetical protein